MIRDAFRTPFGARWVCQRGDAPGAATLAVGFTDWEVTGADMLTHNGWGGQGSREVEVQLQGKRGSRGRRSAPGGGSIRNPCGCGIRGMAVEKVGTPAKRSPPPHVVGLGQN